MNAGVLAWLAGGALAQPVEPAPVTARALGETAEAAGRFGDAVAAFQACVATGSDRDRRACTARLAVLEPQTADGFAGWSVLADVRRDRARLDPEEARARIAAALTANPSGPAAGELERWLTHWELETHGRVDEGAVAAADAGWVAERLAFEERTIRHRWIGRAGAGLAAVYSAAALFGRGRLAWEGAALAGTVVGGIPALLALAWDAELFGGFAASALVVAVCVLLAPRAPAPVRAVGTIGALAAVAWWNGWLLSLGIP